MDLFLVQHGEARPESEDPERSLTDRGAEAVRRMASWAARVGVKVEQIRHSGKRRAEQTAALLAERLSPPQGMVAVEGLNPNDDVRPVAEALKGEPGAVMLVGHLPFLDRLTSLLLTDDAEAGVIRFCNAGIVCLSDQEGKCAVNWVIPPNLIENTMAVTE
jgi:phosphohistidine phosphatase